MELLTVAATAIRLQSLDIDISRRWLHDLCNDGRGPAHHHGEHLGKPSILIDWKDAVSWAQAYKFNKKAPPPPRSPRELFAGLTEVAQATDGMGVPATTPINDPIALARSDAASDALELPIIADILAMWVRTRHPTRWARFLYLHKGQARLDRLNAITTEILRLGSKRLASVK